MKKTMIKLILTSLLLAASTATPALADGGGLPPLCYPKACPPIPAGTETLTFSGPGQPPLCYPGEPACPIKAAMATEVRFSGPGFPPLCYPGEPNCPIK